MDFPSVRCLLEEGYQYWLAALLPDVHRRSSVPVFATTDFLRLPWDMGQPNFMTDCSYWDTKFLFEGRVGDCQKVFAGCHNVELFSMRVPNRSKYCCDVPL